MRAAVVLGSGGARGYAHVGALEVIRERGFEVVAIAGTSMGALVGGVAAANKLDEYTAWARSLTQREVWRLLDLSIMSSGGAIRAERIITKVGEILEGAMIDELPIPYTAVATDINARREVWFQHGMVEHAIRASIAIPGVITPVIVNGRTLVDGGLINPVPIEPTAAVETDLTIAVSLSGARVANAPATPVKVTAEHRPLDEIAARLRRATDSIESERFRSIATRLSAGHRKGSADDVVATEPQAPDLGMLDLLTMSFDTMSALICRYRMAANPPDVLVTVPSNAVRTLDFHKAAEMIDLGRTLTTEALDRAGY
ncbi:MAG: patatin-like phospholipase family protein [Terracoccus sp.]